MTTSSYQDEFSAVIREVERLEGRFRHSSDSLTLATEDETSFMATLREGLSILELALGPTDGHRRQIAQVVHENSGGYPPQVSFYAVQSTRKYMEVALRQIRRVDAARTAIPTTKISSRPPYVAQSRIAEIAALSNRKWDLSKLLKLIEELNNAYERGDFFSVALLLCTVKDHVPPIFEAPNFASVVATSTKSLRGNLERLEDSMKNIADSMIHTHARVAEALPNENQVEFRADFDVLLAQVVQRLRS